MQLDKENIKKIVGIVSFAILLNWGLKNTRLSGKAVGAACWADPAVFDPAGRWLLSSTCRCAF